MVAPKKVAEATWSKEAAKWDHLQHLRVSTVLGSASKRIKALNTPADVYVINRENFEWLVDYYQQAGRGARDGGKARCVLLYKKSDYDVNRYVIEQNQTPGALNYALNALDRMKEYADSNDGCMVQRLLSALGEELETPCGRCTCCQKARRQR